MASTDLPHLTRSLQAFGTPAFEATLKAEVAALGPDALQLQQGLASGSISLGDGIGVMILRVRATAAAIQVRVGIFYTSMLAGCACSGDPSSEEEQAEYLEADLEIDRQDGAARLHPVSD
jgi:hypothetical protein